MYKIRRTKPTTLHETIVRDVVDIMTDVKNTDELQFVLNKGKSLKSVASGASNLTIVFPDVVDASTDIKTAIMIAKAREKKCVSMLQMLFSAFMITDASNAADYIAKFHSNLKIDDDITISKFIGLVDNLANKLDENAGISVDRDLYEAVKEDLKNLDYYFRKPVLNETPLSAYRYSRLNGGHVIKEAGAKPVGVDDSQTKDLMNVAKYKKDSVDAFRVQILDSDIKKANELMPTMMVINFVNTSSNDKTPVMATSVIGVKVKVYPAETMDIIDRVIAKNQDGNGLNKFIRATTREISFWRDFVFAIDKAKLDALGSSRRGDTSPIWKLLERRAMKSRIRRSFRFTNDATAITSLDISSSAVEYLKKNNNIDLRDERVARRIMEAFNLMSIGIVDESMETVEFIYDTGDDLYETLTFNSLEREASDSTYKKVVNLMTKMH